MNKTRRLRFMRIVFSDITIIRVPGQLQTGVDSFTGVVQENFHFRSFTFCFQIVKLCIVYCGTMVPMSQKVVSAARNGYVTPNAPKNFCVAISLVRLPNKLRKTFMVQKLSAKILFGEFTSKSLSINYTTDCS